MRKFMSTEMAMDIALRSESLEIVSLCLSYVAMERIIIGINEQNIQLRSTLALKEVDKEYENNGRKVVEDEGAQLGKDVSEMVQDMFR